MTLAGFLYPLAASGCGSPILSAPRLLPSGAASHLDLFEQPARSSASASTIEGGLDGPFRTTPGSGLRRLAALETAVTPTRASECVGVADPEFARQRLAFN
jgi:hypothetical protein